MSIVSETVKVIPHGKTVKYYREKGYDAKNQCELEVKIADLSPGSGVLIEVTCDYCGKLKPPMRYIDYMRETENGIKKCCCADCAPLKREEVIFERYGYKNAMQVPEIKEKTKQTNLDRYGAETTFGSAEIRERIKQTIIERYGVENPGQSKEIIEKMKHTNLEMYGVENQMSRSEIRDKVKNTVFERYGVDSVLKIPSIKDKRTKTLIERFGVTSPLQNKECLAKLKQTNLEKYGVEFASQSESVKQKAKQTNLDRYGVENPAQNKDVLEKAKNTNLERYGVESILCLPSFHEHAREVDIERYGVYHHLQNPEILEKQKETFYKNGTCPTSKQQAYLNQIYCGELNYPLMMYNIDIALQEEKIAIEFDGSGHNLSVKIGELTQEEFNRKEIIRNNVIKRAGYKQIRIISYDDKIPSDEMLLQMLDDARTYFSQYPKHSWYEFNISASTIRNAENKLGLPYNYGYLRRIK